MRTLGATPDKAVNPGSYQSQTARIATTPAMSHGTIDQLTIDSLLRRCMRRKACCRSLSALSKKRFGVSSDMNATWIITPPG